MLQDIQGALDRLERHNLKARVRAVYEGRPVPPELARPAPMLTSPRVAREFLEAKRPDWLEPVAPVNPVISEALRILMTPEALLRRGLAPIARAPRGAS